MHLRGFHSPLSNQCKCKYTNLHLVAAYKTNKAFTRLQTILEKPHADSILGSGQEEHKGV